jgi:hypothetical protein
MELLMKPSRVLAPVALLLSAAATAAGPPVTSKQVPSPAQEVARRWVAAAFQMPLLDYADERFPRSEAVRMLAALQHGEKLGPGVGWFGPSQRRHDWSWLAARFDSDGDGRITRKEFTGEVAFFDRLDRDRDGAVTADDFDWSEQSPWVRREAQALALFRAIDSNGDGRATEEETQAYFKKLAGAKGHLMPEDLRKALGGGGGGGGEGGKAKRVSKETWIECLMAGDLGSPFEGPRVGKPAPDFTLATHDGKKQVTLSDYRDKRPVVLIFGSFT